jgi:hypothetical protein
MKNFLLITVIFFSFSCSDYSGVKDFIKGKETKSRRGDWNNTDKQLARNFVEKQFRSDNSDPSKFPQTVACIVRRMETNYENFEESEYDYEGLGEIFSQCFIKELSNTLK